MLLSGEQGPTYVFRYTKALLKRPRLDDRVLLRREFSAYGTRLMKPVFADHGFTVPLFFRIRLSNAPVVPLGLLIYLLHERSGSGAEAA